MLTTEPGPHRTADTALPARWHSSSLRAGSFTLLRWRGVRSTAGSEVRRRLPHVRPKITGHHRAPAALSEFWIRTGPQSAAGAGAYATVRWPGSRTPSHVVPLSWRTPRRCRGRSGNRIESAGMAGGSWCLGERFRPGRVRKGWHGCTAPSTVERSARAYSRSADRPSGRRCWCNGMIASSRLHVTVVPCSTSTTVPRRVTASTSSLYDVASQETGRGWRQWWAVDISQTKRARRPSGRQPNTECSPRAGGARVVAPAARSNTGARP